MQKIFMLKCHRYEIVNVEFTVIKFWPESIFIKIFLRCKRILYFIYAQLLFQKMQNNF
jgi:hypothetical protein